MVCLIPDVCASVGLSPLWNNIKSNGHACVFVSVTSSLELRQSKLLHDVH